MERVACLVIGAGVVGLAVARALALSGRETVLLERERAIGTGTSSRSSEVIHAGLYYPHGSLKARLCVRGRRLLYAYCAARGVPHRRCGKLIVATSAGQLPALRRIQATAQANGVTDLHWLDAHAALELEPQLHCVAALHSGSTGILDSHAFTLALQTDFEAAGGLTAHAAPVLGGRRDGRGWVLTVGAESPMEIGADLVVNCAGLHAQAVAATLRGLPAAAVPPIRYAKGNYYALRGRVPFSRLIYPVPEPGGLGVHLTLDLGGQGRFGPDVEWVDHLDYRVDPRRSAGFHDAIRRYWPTLPEDALQPAYSGIRPKTSGPDELAQDFTLQGPAAHGVPGLVNLFGIESPGLTSALAIAEHVCTLAQA